MTLNKARKRGPKGPRNNDEPALVRMDALVRGGMSILAAAREVIREGIAPVPHTPEATVERLRALYRARATQSPVRHEVNATQPPVRQEGRIAYTLAERAWDEALSRAFRREPLLLRHIMNRPNAIPDATWMRIRLEARDIEREIA